MRVTGVIRNDVRYLYLNLSVINRLAFPKNKDTSLWHPFSCGLFPAKHHIVWISGLFVMINATAEHKSAKNDFRE